jgi:hypothetical protein
VKNCQNRQLLETHSFIGNSFAMAVGAFSKSLQPVGITNKNIGDIIRTFFIEATLKSIFKYSGN